jgi:hypothetical protein
VDRLRVQLRLERSAGIPPNRSQISAALSQIVGGCGGHWGADFDGLIGAFVLDEPDPANVIFRI